MHELLVAVDLLRLGWQVFRCISPCGSCDLVAMRADDLLRVEVTTAVRNKNGTWGYPAKDSRRYDILALVTHAGEIMYRPTLPV